MSQLENAFVAGLNRLMSLNSGTLTFNGASITVFKSFMRNTNYSTTRTGYDVKYDDLYVLAKTSDIVGWNLVPSVSEVTLDGTAYYLGQSITEAAGFATIWLRRKN